MSKIEFREPTRPDSVENAARQLGGLPESYKDFLLRSGGALGIDTSLILYSADEIVERNQTWETAKYAPGYVAIGDDGEGRVIVTPQDESDPPVSYVDSGAMTVNRMRRLSDAFSKWEASGFALPE